MTITRDSAAPEAIAREALDAIGRHGAETYPDECCGALLARGGIIIEAFRLPNTTAEGARRRFTVSPSDYRQAEARARAIAGTLAGFYHSHPDHPAHPSPHDLEQAWPNLTYVIAAVRSGTPEDVTAWRLREDRTAFEPVELLCHTES
jgi:proteasome lid subunit RPN8/RPN11